MERHRQERKDMVPRGVYIRVLAELEALRARFGVDAEALSVADLSDSSVPPLSARYSETAGIPLSPVFADSQ